MPTSVFGLLFFDPTPSLDPAVREIRDHFKKVENGYSVAVIEQIWLKERA